jgi:hypothetical protein
MATTLEELMAHRPECEFTVAVSPAQRAEFRARGFVAIERIMPDEEIAWLGQGLRSPVRRADADGPRRYFELSRPYDSPGVGAPLPWHQDEAYWDPEFNYVALGSWTPLDPATLESGCMRFIPGSHCGDVRTHRHVGDDPTVHGLYAPGIDPSCAVALPILPGGVIFHHCRILHSPGPNRSDRVRRAYANEWQT